MISLKFNLRQLNGLWVKVVVLRALKSGLNWAALLAAVLYRETHHMPSDTTTSEAAHIFVLCLS